MRLRTAAIVGTTTFVTVITGLQLWLNPGEKTPAQSFRVGFLPVT